MKHSLHHHRPRTRHRRLLNRTPACRHLLICFTLLCWHSTEAQPREKTAFQTSSPWIPEIDTRSDMAIVYGTGDRKGSTFEQRVQSWRDRGYNTAFMTGIAWGQYYDYFLGQWDGQNHLGIGQVTQKGDTIMHGKNMPYVVPVQSFIEYMKTAVVKRVIDAGITTIFLEEPEFWARAGYSTPFKQEWQKFYGFPWRPQDASPENTYLSSKLKYQLYYNAIKQVSDYAKDYAKQKGTPVKVYIATHSLVNYSSWKIVSPEASLASLPGIDGYIAQVWTGTSREPTYFDGRQKERVFENAYLEYGSMLSMTAPTGRKVYFLTDPIEDWPRDWADYKKNYQATFTAEILYPTISDYEVMPWPERIYTRPYKLAHSDSAVLIPRYYSTQMQVMINVLNDMPRSTNSISGSSGIGVLMSNSLMFQRFPTHNGYDDPQFSNFYGQTLPLIKRGIPVQTVHMENLSYPATLANIKVLIMSYSNMKPQGPEAHRYLAEWVRKGGVLVYCGQDVDPYQSVMEWWNTKNNHYTAPSRHLFALLGLKTTDAGRYPVGKGAVYILRQDPKNFVLQTGGDASFFATVKQAYTQDAHAGDLIIKNSFYLERGPYDIISVLDENPDTKPYTVHGPVIDLFDPQLPVLTEKTVNPGEQSLLYDLARIPDRQNPQVLASASRIYEPKTSPTDFSFIAKSPINTNNSVRVLLPAKPDTITVTDDKGQPIPNVESSWDASSNTEWLGFPNNPDGITVRLTFSQTHPVAQNDPVDLVNPLMGTDSKPSLSNGNTYPSVALPWGMNLWTPQTGENGSGWQYTYAADKIRGFKQTHQPSPWMNDYGMFSIMPVTGGLKVNQDDRASWFSHKTETAKPYYYGVYLADANVTAEMVPTERSAQFRFTYPETDSASIVIDAFDGGSSIHVFPAEHKITGYSTKFADGPLKNFRNYFVIYVDKPFTFAQTYNDSVLNTGLETTTAHALAVVGFATQNGERIHLRVASSFVSAEQAELNLQREQEATDFETLKNNARDTWNKTLSRVTVQGGSMPQRRTFYSCLYRMLFFPNKLYEIDAQNKPIHWSPYNGQTLPGYMFAGTGFWDTFRALYPFLNLVYPSIVKEMQEGLINDYKEGGWLPEWSSPGYSDVMVGNNSASVVAEAWLKGLRGYDIEILYQALVHDAASEGPRAAGRKGAGFYNSLGYVPYDVHINENAARTLEYAYDDYAIWQLGKALGKPDAETEPYRKRALNYRNLFDPSTSLMRGRNKDGSWETPFNPFKWGDAFTEGNSWHYTWCVFQDIQGLIDLVGGRQRFTAKLDSVFTLPPVFDDSYYHFVIHEIREMQIAGMGQYAHGNQPIQHMIYLYDYAGQPWKTQYWTRQTMNKLYKATPDGYCGDEDNGQTSAWYVFSALGFYPVTPASDHYALGVPLFQHAAIHLENGNTIAINAPANSIANVYTQSLNLNGVPWPHNYLSHQTLLQGATLDFTLSPTPNNTRGTQPSDAPWSMSSH